MNWFWPSLSALARVVKEANFEEVGSVWLETEKGYLYLGYKHRRLGSSRQTSLVRIFLRRMGIIIIKALYKTTNENSLFTIKRSSKRIVVT